MYNRITSFLYENKILSEAQNGFRKGKSIDTAVQSYIEKIQKALDSSIHSFIMHSVNPYKVNQPIGYRTCHNTSVLQSINN
jgi:hypothetical protein